MADYSESLLWEMEGELVVSPKSNTVPSHESPPTTYSLLDMDLTRFSELANPLTPQTAVKDDINGNGGPQPVTSALINNSGSRIQQQLQKMIEDQHHHRQELKDNMEQMTNKITTQNEQVNKALTGLFHEKQQEVVKHMDKQFEYLQTQLNASMSWRLNHYHTDLLKDLCSALTPMSVTITNLHEELSKCNKTIDTLSEEMTAAKVSTTFGHVSVQTHPVVLQEEKPLPIPNRPRLQSTVQPGLSENNFGSPGGLPFMRK